MVRFCRKMTILVSKSICTLKRSFVLLLGLFSLGTTSLSQEIRLSNRFVIDMDLDAQDRVWIATEEGLNCFDGIETTAYMKRPDGLPVSHINSVLADSTEPLVWVAMQKGGLACLDQRTDRFTVYRAGDVPDSLSDNDLNHIEQAPDGAIWVSTFSKGLCKFNRQTGSFDRYNADTFSGMQDHSLHTFTFRGDQLILGHWEDGVSILSLTDHTRIDLRYHPDDPTSLPSDEIRALLVDSQQRIWVGTLDGLALYSDSDGSFTVFHPVPGHTSSSPEGAVYDLAEDSRGRLLVATGSGSIYALDISAPGRISAESPFVLLTQTGVADLPAVRTLVVDRFGNCWAGTYGQGLVFLSGKPAGAGKQAIPGNSNEDAEMPALLLEKEGNGVYVQERGQLVPVPLPSQDISVFSLAEDGAVLWVGTDKGLWRIDRKSGQIIHHYTRQDDGLPDDLIRALLLDRAGNLWLGTYGSGLAIFDKDMQQLAAYEGGSGLPSDRVNHFLLDRDGRIWAATAGGVVRFDEGPGQISALFQTESGLPDDNIRALAEDAGGRIWMSGNESVFCLSPDGSVRAYDSRDGLPDGNYYAAAVATSRNRIWFGNTDGVGWVEPEVLLSSKELPAVEFLTPESQLSTGWKDNHLQLRFRVPDYSYSSNAEYSYRLVDMDQDWRPCGKELEFNHLPYGKHTLQVRARLHSEAWPEEFSQTTLTVRPPVWLTWWAKVIYALLTLALLGFAVQRWLYKTKKKNQERLQQDLLLAERQANEERMVFYTNITHELRTPLTLILGPLEDLSEDEDIPAKARSRIGKARQSAQQLLSLVNKLLEFRKTETGNRRLSVREGDLSRCVNEVGERFRDLSTNKAVRFLLAVEPDIRLQFDPEAIVIILNNLLANAQKFTPSGQIVLALQREEKKVALTVSDTGCGIPSKDLPHIFDQYYQVKGPLYATGTGVGLALVKNLCELHHIELSVQSEVGKGSEFRLLLDPAEDYPEALHPVMEYLSEAEETQEPPAEPDRVRVLVVEDNPDILEYIRESLDTEFSVLTATQGREGLKIAIREIPDIIVSDIMMPGMDGIDMCKAIRQDVRTSHIPVILLTAKGSEEDRQEGYEVGADSYLVKPFRKALLISRIRNLLERRERLMAEFSETGTSPGLSPVDNEFLERYAQYVEEHISDERIDITSLACEFAMSQSTLYRKVKAVCGLSPAELVRNIRLSKAAALLESKTLSIADVAWRTGFGSPIYFRTCFKERYGQTPSEYRAAKSPKQG